MNKKCMPHIITVFGLLVLGFLGLACATTPEPVVVLGEGDAVIEDGVLVKLNKSFYGTIEIPNGVTKIGTDAFKGASLESIIIPNSVTEIADGAFNNTLRLWYIKIPSSVTKIGKSFQGSGLKSITLPATLKSLANGAFKDCHELTSLKIPEGSMTELQGREFWQCFKLKTIELPPSVTEIGYEAFYSCNSLETIRLAKGTVVSPDAYARTGWGNDFTKETTIAMAAGIFRFY